jgi:hypothetical protein
MIAIMSDVVSDAKYNGKKAFLKLRAELIAEVETFFISSSQQRNQDWFPKNIYYQINIEEVNKWKLRKLRHIDYNKLKNDDHKKVKNNDNDISSSCSENCRHVQNELKSKISSMEEKLDNLLSFLNNDRLSHYNNYDDDGRSIASNATYHNAL